jgi:integrase
MKTSSKNPVGTKTARDRLQPRRGPYFVRLRAGLYVGYRVLRQGEGTWIARLRTPEGKQTYAALGHFDSFDLAAAASAAWADAPKDVAPAIAPVALTVATACEQYVTHQKLHKSLAASKDAEARFRRLIYGKPIAAMSLSDLKTVHIHSWIAAQIEGKEGEAQRRAKDTANRSLTAFKAALNLAMKNGLIASDAGWRTVVPFRNVGRRRQGFVASEERAALMAACPSDLRAFVRALLLTGARPGELANVRFGDFDRQQGTLQVSGKTGHRVVLLSSAAAAFFAERAEFKAGTAHLFTCTDGKAWIKERWIKAFRAARTAAGLPEGIVLYSLRHTAISEFIAHGIDVFTVAKLAGTSVQIIEAHYGHLVPDRTRRALDTVSIV